MSARTWVILGGTSIIAEQFAHIVAAKGYNVRLVGRDNDELQIRACDIKLRYKVACEVVVVDMTNLNAKHLAEILKPGEQELDLFIAHSDFTENADLNAERISHLIHVNVLSTALAINAYMESKQSQHNLVYLSSVAACMGRAKNSLYGASKAAIEVYLQGLQQAASKSQSICIARLGFIDTQQTYGLPGIFYAAPPENCARACWNALIKRKKRIYYPGFWRLIMALVTRLPFLAGKN
jgi:short-subunit dehydrogenase